MPGDRIPLDSDVCPVESLTYFDAGTNLLFGIASLESDLAFNTWMRDLLIPEECSNYRTKLTQ